MFPEPTPPTYTPPPVQDPILYTWSRHGCFLLSTCLVPPTWGIRNMLVWGGVHMGRHVFNRKDRDNKAFIARYLVFGRPLKTVKTFCELPQGDLLTYSALSSTQQVLITNKRGRKIKENKAFSLCRPLYLYSLKVHVHVKWGKLVVGWLHCLFCSACSCLLHQLRYNTGVAAWAHSD